MSTITMKNGRSRVASRYFDFSASSSTREVISSTSSVADSSSWETSRLPIGPSKSSGDRMCGSQRSQSPSYGWATWMRRSSGAWNTAAWSTMERTAAVVCSSGPTREITPRAGMDMGRPSMVRVRRSMRSRCAWAIGSEIAMGSLVGFTNTWVASSPMPLPMRVMRKSSSPRRRSQIR